MHLLNAKKLLNLINAHTHTCTDHTITCHQHNTFTYRCSQLKINSMENIEIYTSIRALLNITTIHLFLYNFYIYEKDEKLIWVTLC